MSKPVAVLVSDIHFTPANLELASASLTKALEAAKKLNVPLVVAGDTLDSKAIIRGECANRLLTILENHYWNTYMLVGNHDMINEKANEHSLNFLRRHCFIVDSLHYADDIGSWLIPYQHDSERLREMLEEVGDGERIIMHQGVETAFMGHYVQDKTSLPPETFANFRVISGHYHRHQDIKTGRPRKGAVGLFTYIGTPYTQSFAEANDGPKGCKILLENGLLHHIDFNLRKHVIVELEFSGQVFSTSAETPRINPGDLVWAKVKGTHSAIASLNQHSIRDLFTNATSVKLEKIYTDTERKETKSLAKLSDSEILDEMIDRTGETSTQKEALKKLWRELL